MLEFVIAGLALGGIYAIASAGLVITYTSSGILNFAFGAMAYFIARLYYYLHTQQNWSITAAAIVSIGIAAPLMGVVLYAVLFRFLRFRSPLIKVVATIGLLVAIPGVATVIFGTGAILQAPGLAPEPVHVYQFLGVPITLDQIIVYICVVATVVIGAVVLRYTEVGLKVRAMVDSPALTDLSGTNPELVSAGVWAVSVFFAGLTGVLAAPGIGLDAGQFTLLVAAAFAAVIAAKMRSLPIAVGVGLLMGIATSLAQRYLPSNSQWTAEIIDAIPFIVIALVLLYNLARRGRVGEIERVGGALDRAITPQGESKLAGSTTSALETGSLSLVSKYAGPLVLIVAVSLLPLVLQGYWVGVMAQAFAFAVIFLSWTLVTGEGGMLWLCQITFAGIGAFTTGRIGDQPRLARAGRRPRRRCGRDGHRPHRRAPEHPSRGPLCRTRHTHVRADRGEPGVHPAPVREQRAGALHQPPELRHLRPCLCLRVPGGLHHHCAVHRELPPVDLRSRHERSALE